MLDYDYMKCPDFPDGELRFMELLRNAPDLRPRWDMTIVPADGEADFRNGFCFLANFPDPEKLLETAEKSLLRTLSFADAVKPDGSVIETRAVSDLEGESYRVIIEKSAIRIESATTEGIRRGIYYVEELLLNSRAPILKTGVTEKKPWLKNRISRCFFGPIKRPPFNRDELMDEIDYYPEEYLNRLAREGVNGLWLTIVFREICNTSLYPRCPDADKRIAKLRRTVERCRRYGIKIWTFCIEPFNWNDLTNPCPAEHPELKGPFHFNGFTFCPNSETAQKYLYECTNSLFSSVPHLGGLMTISYGERVTSCLSARNPSAADDTLPCSGKCGLSSSGVLNKILTPLAKGIHDVDPDAGLISWLYIPTPAQCGSWVNRLPEELSKDVILAMNFESGCSKIQLGKVRNGGDYWLSCVGPSDRFACTAAAAKGRCDMAAKLQVCCSHEMATIPFVPVPGLIYRKYKEMYKLGVKHAVQCWYFGNYPGLMNKAAARLAFEDFSRSEDEFLRDLAFSDWGEEKADTIVKVWKNFVDSYSNYPLDIQFQYYGPMHDGAVWPLHLKLSRKAMTRSWKPDLFPAGDAVGESMRNHNLAEVALLTRQMADAWQRGMDIFKTVEADCADCRERLLDSTLYHALNVHMASGANVMEFYLLRNELIDSPKDPAPLLDRIEEIIGEEITNSLTLADLCEKDSRLGYHSEAEVYKYFPEKLRWRADMLRKLLAGTFAECRAYAAAGRPLGELLDEQEEYHHSGVTYTAEKISWRMEKEGVMLKIDVDVKRVPGAKDERVFLFLSDRKVELHPWNVMFDRSGLRMDTRSGAVVYESDMQENSWHLTVRMAHGLIGGEKRFCFGCEYYWVDENNHGYSKHYPAGVFGNESRLNLGFYTPDRTVPVEL